VFELVEHGHDHVESSQVNPFQYTARESDTETGLYYYRARYYDPTAGRFLSEDPLRVRAGVNFYRYVRNNVVNRRDPSGLAPCAAAAPTLGPVICDCYLFAGLLRRFSCHYLCVCSDGGPDYFGFRCPETSPDAGKFCPIGVIIRTPPPRSIWPSRYAGDVGLSG